MHMGSGLHVVSPAPPVLNTIYVTTTSPLGSTFWVLQAQEYPELTLPRTHSPSHTQHLP